MTKHVYNEVIVWDNYTETETIKNLCEKCGQREGEALECTPIKVNMDVYNTKYLDKALKALAKVS